jgi:uncharacterized protein (DUF983 family)
MRRFAANFVIWIVSVIALLAIFTFVPQQSGWFWPVVITWFVIVGAVATLRSLRSRFVSLIRDN